MYMSRTPLRVSFFGGGTDYPEYFSRYPGAVLGTSIDKFIYISALRLERFIGYSYRLSYSINEEVDQIDQIKHPVFREVLKAYRLGRGWNIGVLSSLPARSGLGSSSAFTVGLLKIMSYIKGEALTRYDLAQKATHFEREVLGENVGVQDQLHASFGSLNRYDFANGSFTIRPIRLHASVRDALNGSMYLIHTGIARYASEIAQEQVEKTASRKIDQPLSHLYQLTDQACRLLEGDDPDAIIAELGAMLHDGWMTKRGLSSAVSTPAIDEIYETARRSGAFGGKLCGVGGGGFFLAIVPPHARARVSEALGDRELIPIAMDETGSLLLNT